MRFVLVLGLVVAAATPAVAAPARSYAISGRATVTTWRPRAWAPPVRTAALAPAMRFDPEDGTAPLGLDQAAAARRQALARIPIQTHADGRRSAVVGGAFRAYTIARIDEHGQLVQDCVHSEEQAIQSIAAPAAPAAKKER